MATTKTADVTDQIPKLWSKQLLAQAENRTFWKSFEGPEGSGMPIIRKDDLTKQAGDTIHMDLVMALSGAGVTGGSPSLVGNEEKLGFRQLDLGVDALAHAVRREEKAEVLNIHDLRSVSLRQLAKWLAGKLDDAVWDEFTGSGNTTVPADSTFYGGSATDVDSITSSDYITLDDISDIKAYAQTTPKIEPLRMDNGEEYFGLVVHPYTNLALKKSSDYKQAQRDADVSGRDGNALFTGATFLWDGVIGFVSNRVPTAANAASSPVDYAKNIFFGGQALMRGFAQYPDWREEFFEYGTQAGVATTLIKGEKLAVYDLSAAADGSNETALGSLQVNAYAGAPS
jgi:N4-gp56 family major capsid protein